MRMEKDSIDIELRNRVTMIGVLSFSLSVGAVLTYAVLQVPTLRSIYGEYQLEDEYLNNLVYTVEVILVVSGTISGIFVNILLMFGAQKRKRWFLVHWLLFYGLLITILHVVSILIFIFATNMNKLYGLVTVCLDIVAMFFWKKVYDLFTLLGKRIEPQVGAITDRVDVDTRSGCEFYPVDPISRSFVTSLHRSPPPPPQQLSASSADFISTRVANNLMIGRFFRFYDTKKLEDESCDQSIDLESSGSSDTVNI